MHGRHDALKATVSEKSTQDQTKHVPQTTHLGESTVAQPTSALSVSLSVLSKAPNVAMAGD